MVLNQVWTLYLKFHASYRVDRQTDTIEYSSSKVTSTTLKNIHMYTYIIFNEQQVTSYVTFSILNAFTIRYSLQLFRHYDDASNFTLWWIWYLFFSLCVFVLLSSVSLLKTIMVNSCWHSWPGFDQFCFGVCQIS